MKRIVIFDFNRTLFDPDKRKLIPGTRPVLKKLKAQNFKLYLISRAGESRRTLIDSLGIKKHFARVIIHREKRLRDFEFLINRKTVDRRGSFVIGDRLKSEIAFGNRLGVKTILVRRGKFARESASGSRAKPSFIIRELKEILKIIN